MDRFELNTIHLSASALSKKYDPEEDGEFIEYRIYFPETPWNQRPEELDKVFRNLREYSNVPGFRVGDVDRFIYWEPLD